LTVEFYFLLGSNVICVGLSSGVTRERVGEPPRLTPSRAGGWHPNEIYFCGRIDKDGGRRRRGREGMAKNDTTLSEATAGTKLYVCDYELYWLLKTLTFRFGESDIRPAKCIKYSVARIFCSGEYFACTCALYWRQWWLYLCMMIMLYHFSGRH